MMTQQHERHFKPRISKEVSLTLRLLEKREFPHEFVEMSWSKSSKHIIKSTQYKSGYVLGRYIETYVGRVCVVVISHFTRPPRRIRKRQHVLKSNLFQNWHRHAFSSYFPPTFEFLNSDSARKGLFRAESSLIDFVKTDFGK